MTQKIALSHIVLVVHRRYIMSEVVVRKGHKTLVVRVKVKNLDVKKCSKGFLQKNISLNDEVLVKCDQQGNMISHGQFYSIYKI
jgi:hypothetical protein